MGATPRQSADGGCLEIPLERIPAPPPASFRDLLLSRDRPALITGAMVTWPTLARWHPEVIRQRYGALEFSPSIDFPITGRPYEQVWRDYQRRMTLAQFVDHMSTTERPCYVRRQQIGKWPGAVGEFGFDFILPPDPAGERAYVWLGSNTVTPLHFDMSHGLLCQMHGRKQVFAFAPSDSRRLYPYAHSCTKSPVLPSAPDLAAFPRYSEATAHVGILEAGEILFLPAGWWHSIVALGMSVSISREFDENMRWSDVTRALSAGGAAAWAATARDFLWHGLLGRPHERRLFDDPPMGAMLYRTVADGMRRRIWAGR